MRIVVNTKFDVDSEVTLAAMARHPEAGNPTRFVVRFIRIDATATDCHIQYWCRCFGVRTWGRHQDCSIGVRLATGEVLFHEEELVPYPAVEQP